MKIKYEPEDFRVRELLAEGVLIGYGEHRVYRVTKRKLTSLQAADVLGNAAGVNAGDIGMCGLKDRQGITTQHMSIPRGKGVAIKDDDLRVETVGFSADGLTSEASTGNAFDLTVRGLSRAELATLSQNLIAVRRVGLINYFDDQRFGNLRHNQGWIALDLLRGDVEAALKTLLTAASEYELPRSLTFKNKLFHAWGDWADCRDLAGRFGQYHSVFEHLKKNPDDFAGAFFHVASRLRLIHLYAYQSHLWNRAVADFVRGHVPIAQRAVVDTREGPLVYPAGEVSLPLSPEATFRLPGPKLEDVTDERQHALLADALAADRLVPAKFAIEGVPGFQLKGEERSLFVEPRHLRTRPPEPDPLNRPLSLVRVRFELPRGAYATLVVRRLLTERLGEPEQREPPREVRSEPRDRRPWREQRESGAERGPGSRERGPRGNPDRRPDRRDERQPPREHRERPLGSERAPREGYRPRNERGSGRFDRARPARDDGPPRGRGERPAREREVQPWNREGQRDGNRGAERGQWRGPPRAGERVDRGPRGFAPGRPPRDGDRPPRDRDRPPREGGDRPWKPAGRRYGDGARGPRDERSGPPRERDTRGRAPRRPPPRKKPKHD